MFANLLRGAAAGAAATTVLNAVTYLDMAWRARPASDLPEQAVDEWAKRAGRPVPGEGQQRQNRLHGLGPLAGIGTGVGVGMAAGLLRPIVTRLPAVFGAALLGGAAMAASDVPLAKLGLSDPTKWSGQQWASDAIPHLAYGLTAIAMLRSWPRRKDLVTD